MGGSSKKVTVGYKYYLGMHMILCHGPIDYLRRIEVDKRLAYSGKHSGGSLALDKTGLFGGESREGGISGTLDLEFGGPTQTQNDYLQARLGTDIPAFRGVVGAVLRQMYLGVNPYLKTWAFRLQRIHTRQDGITQWYDEASEISSGSDSAAFLERFNDGLSPYSILTINGSTGSLSNFDIVSDTYGKGILIKGGTAANHPAAARELPTQSSLYRLSAKFKLVSSNVDDCGILVLRDASEAAIVVFNVSRDSGVDSSRRPTVAFTDQSGNPGNPIGSGQVNIGEWYSLDALYSDESGEFTCSIVNLEDNTTFGSVTVDVGARSDIFYLSFENDGGSNSGSCIFSDVRIILEPGQDMNPAHIIRECLTDPDWGMGYQDADIDEDSFRIAADALYSENMGISLLWDRQISIEDFVMEIIRHINATLYIDRVSGKFVLKLIRGDYIEDDLILLDESNISKISDYSRVDHGDIINSVTVVFWDNTTGENASVTVDNIALIQAYGAVIGTTIQYPGFTNSNIATRAAQRDLKTLSSPLLSCTIEANREASSLNIGDVFKFEWPQYHSGYVVMRVMQIAFGDGKKNRVKITASEDVFALPTTSIVIDDEPAWEEPGGPPVQTTRQLIFESPYYELVQFLGQTTVDDQLTSTPEIGYLQVAAERPANAINAQVWVDAGSGYEDAANLDFCPTCELAADITAGQTSITIENGSDLDLVTIGTHCQIDDELCVVTALDEDLGTATIGRSVLDTAARPHLAGSVIYFWDVYSTSDSTEYVSSEIIDVKILPNTNQGPFDLASATEYSVTMYSRAYRPYPPGNVKINTEAFPESISGSAAISLTWAHRDRTQQTSGTIYDYTEGNIGPEASTTYTIRLYNENGVLSKTLTGETGTSYTWSTESDDSGISNVDGDAYFDDVTLLFNGNGTDGSTSITDVRGHTLTLFGNTQIDTDDLDFPVGGILFDGSGDYIRIPQITNELTFTGDFTIEVDYKPQGDSSAGDLPTIFNTFTTYTTNGGIGLYDRHTGNPNKFSVALNGSFPVLESTTVPTDGTKYTIQISRSGSTVRLFINGVIEDTYTYAGTVAVQGGYWWIGTAGNGVAGSTIYGHLARFRVTKGVARNTANYTPEAALWPTGGSYRLNGKITYQIESVRDSLDSFQYQEHTVRREGYGFNYGYYYGGA